MVRVIDASGCVLGRLASGVAKALLTSNEPIHVVNCEDAVITGHKHLVLREFKLKRSRGTYRKGPFYPRVPHLIVKRVIRGMLPYGQTKGKDAHKRLRCHLGVPPELKEHKAEKLPYTAPGTLTRYQRLGDVARLLGSPIGTEPVGGGEE